MITPITVEEAKSFVDQNTTNEIVRTFLTSNYKFKIYAKKCDGEIVSVIVYKDRQFEDVGIVTKIYYLLTKPEHKLKGYAKELLSFVVQNSSHPVLYVTNDTLDGKHILKCEPYAVYSGAHGKDYYYLIDRGDVFTYFSREKTL